MSFDDNSLDLYDDDALLMELREAVAATTTVTDHAREAARAAFSWRTIDEELLSLAHDSLEASGPVLVRSASTARVVGFEGRDLSLEVEVDTGQVMGQIIPGRVCRISVVSPSGAEHTVETDESGVFSLALDVTGPVRFTLEVDGETRSTVWITV